jgi:RNA polymerase sigma-70 factor (ECF subfamily)
MGTIVSQDRTALSDTNFENLVNEYGRQVLNTALRVLGDANLANDVHQEVFLSIWRRWPSYNGHTCWPAYLYRATVRKALEIARRANGHRPEALAGSDWDDRRPDGNMQADELQQKLGAALAKLPAHQADAFVLLRLEGLPTAEVAQILGCSAQTVRVHLHRALKKLSRELKPYLG